VGEDEIMVLVVVRDGRELSEQDLLDHCVRHMPRYMVPRYVELRHELLPRTPSEKIAKEKLRAAGTTAATWDREASGFRLPPVR
jgi:crotonobetaine/carnitine-CoA ligase